MTMPNCFGKRESGLEILETPEGVRYLNLCEQENVIDWLRETLSELGQPDLVWDLVSGYLIVDGLACTTLCYLQPFVTLARNRSFSIDFGFLNRYGEGMPLPHLIQYSESLGFGLTWRLNGEVHQNTPAQLKVGEDRFFNNFFVLRDRLIKFQRITQYMGYHLSDRIADSHEIVHYTFSDTREIEALNSAIEFVIKSSINDTFEVQRYGIKMEKNSCSEWELVQTIYVLSKHFFKQHFHNLHRTKKKGLLQKAQDKVEDIKKAYYYLMKDDTYYIAAEDHYTVALERKEVEVETVETKWVTPPPVVKERVVGPPAPFPFLQGYKPKDFLFGQNLDRIKELMPQTAILEINDLNRVFLKNNTTFREITDLVYPKPNYQNLQIESGHIDVLCSKYRWLAKGHIEQSLRNIMASKDSEDFLKNLAEIFFLCTNAYETDPHKLESFYNEMLSPCMCEKSWTFGLEHAQACKDFTTDQERNKYYLEHIEQSSWSSSKKKKTISAFRSEARRAHDLFNKPSEPEPVVELISIPQPPRQVTEVTKSVKKVVTRTLKPKNLIKSEEQHADFIAHTMPADPRIVFRGRRRRFGVWVAKHFGYFPEPRKHLGPLLNIHKQLANLSKKIKRLVMDGRGKQVSKLCKQKHQIRERFTALYEKFENYRKWGVDDYKYVNTDPDFTKYDFQELNLRKRLLLMGGVCWNRSTTSRFGRQVKLKITRKWKNHDILFKSILG
jgi:hypothetical protein